MSSTTVRAQVNRVVAMVALCVVLPVVASVEKLRPGQGRVTAQRAVRLVARWVGVTFQVSERPDGPHPQPAIYVPNHSSPMDIPALLTASPDIRFLAAADLFRIPLLASAMRALGTIPIDRRNSEVAHHQLDALIADADHSSDLAIFAEGGIAPFHERLPFKTGAFALALQTGTPIVPVAIHRSADVLPPRAFLAIRPGTVTVELLDAVPTVGLSLEDRGALRDTVEASIGAALARGPLPTPDPGPSGAPEGG